MKLRTSRTAGVAAVAALSLLVIACGSDDDSTGSNPGATGASGASTATIGFDVHSTGPSGQFGVTVQNAANLMAEQVEAAKGTKFKLHFEDNQLNPQTAVTVFQKLVDLYKTPVVISGGTAPVMAIAPAAKDQKVLVVNVAAVSPVLHTVRPWVINLVPTAKVEGEVLAKYLIDLNLKEAGAINVNNDFGNKSMEAFQAAYEKAGGKLVRQEKSQSGATDFRPQLLRLKQVNPQAIVVMANQGENGTIFNQAVQLGFKSDQLFGTTYSTTPDNFKTAGSAMNGVRGVGFRFDPTKNDKAKKWAADFQAKFNAPADIQGATTATAVELIMQAVREGAKTSEEIRAKVVGVKDWPSLFGPLNFDETGTVNLEIERWSYDNALKYGS